MAEDRLVVLLEGRRAGELQQDGYGRHRFVYDADYRADPDSTPLSTALPLTASTHGGRGLRSFLDGLLPETDEVLARWADQFDVTPNNPFALLKHVGEDVAGAVQFVRPERMSELEPGTFTALGPDAVGDRIRALRADPTAWIPELERGRFSLAGAQAKFALARRGQRWGQTTGALPTTHIFKPTTGSFADQDVAEQLTMRAALFCGLTVAASAISVFGGERTIVVQRYDRVLTDDGWVRVHQEDCCQALGRSPRDKYKVGVREIARLVRDLSSEPDTDLVRFVDALAFNWLIGGTDAHGKNHSLLLSGPEVRLAPLYDLTSVLPYVTEAPGPVPPGMVRGDGLEMAMAVGGHKRFVDVTAGDWEDVARLAGLAPERVLARVQQLADVVVGAVTEAVAGLRLPQPSELPERLVDRVGRHVDRCRLALQGRPAKPRR